jgi:hypothetical protein
MCCINISAKSRIVLITWRRGSEGVVLLKMLGI